MITTRWLIRRDIDDVLAIEENNNQWFAWGEKDFLENLRNTNIIGLAAEIEDKIVGYVIYQLFKHKIHILKLESAGEGVAEALLDKICCKLMPSRRRFVTWDVPDTELLRHQWLKERGFKAIAVKKEFFKLEEADSYYFLYKMNEKDEFKEDSDLTYTPSTEENEEKSRSK